MTTIESSLRDAMALIDYGGDGGLHVNAFEEVRAGDQLSVIRIIRDALSDKPELRERHADLLERLNDPNFNKHWVGKRRLGHIQRCVCSGDEAFLSFGLRLLESVANRDYTKADKVLFASEGPDTQLAWTIAPLLIAEGKTFKEAMRWVATGDEHNDNRFKISLAGLKELSLWRAFVLPDRYDDLFRHRINDAVAPITTHPNYVAAQLIAQELIARNIV
ncbi:hypothetical protein A2Z00_05060 [Candidatus Gottesmanbacteria bacterium RBG_13_45_10]|uniref:Uncharacterized protein n=1 Tax=Candidatus Gottesmanbacteria bacterium RBG_13_45_10 TaxID=1798370 RepID=A0A1F5ZGZ5_9BACT|nr:MAG: hypothetical protein A2Z00_05060 [Candidatus Gottesmanbacteria bacterium RBG_13_45_10]